MSEQSREIRGAAGAFDTDEASALELDRDDPRPGYRDRFRVPLGPDGRAAAYLCGNSLGLQPIGVAEAVGQELEEWATRAVDAHFAARTPWYSYHEALREPTARLVGARPVEVVTMNGLTVNLHLMLVSFYRPTATRDRVLMEEHAFPSDTYAVASHLRYHGRDPSEVLRIARARPGETSLRTEDIVEQIEREGERLALVLIGGVNYLSGQSFDLPAIARAAREAGAVAGFDLAHAAGNVPLRLHDWDVDFAVWCSYKYLNAGPGAVAGCFVHERHVADESLPRLAGWWGNDPATRFRMQEQSDFVPVHSADGWQLSNPPILALAPLRVSLALFDEAGGPEALCERSRRLTGYLESWVDAVGDPRVRVLTPRDPEARGCQLSLGVSQDARDLFRLLGRRGVVGDYREPDTIRVAPAPLYNTFHDVWRFGDALRRWSRGEVERGERR